MISQYEFRDGTFLLELLVYPTIYEIWKWHRAVKRRVERYQEVLA